MQGAAAMAPDAPAERGVSIGRDLIEGVRIVADPSLRPGHDEFAVAVRTSHLDSDVNRWEIRRLTLDGDTIGGPLEGRAPMWSPDGHRLAFLRAAAGSEQLHLTTPDGEPAALTAFPGGVLQARWLPDASGLVVVAPMPTQPLPDGDDPLTAWLRRPIEVDRAVYKLDGLGFQRDLVTGVFLVDLSGEVSPLVLGPHQVQTIAVSPDSQVLAFAATTYDGGVDPSFSLFVVGREGGEPRQLTSAPTGVGAVTWLDDQHVLFAGQRDFSSARFAGLFEVDTDEGTTRRVATDVVDNVGGGPFGNGGAPPTVHQDHVLFTVMRRGTFRLVSWSPADGSVADLAGDERTSVLGYDVDAGRLLTVVADPTSGGEVVVTTLADAQGGTRGTVATTCQDVPADTPVAPPQARDFEAPDGTVVSGWLYGGGSGTPAPLLLDIHGGPHAAWGPALDAVTWYRHALVERGWVVLALNARGSDGYGEGFVQGAVGAWGEADEGDWFAAVDALVDEGIADPERVAVTGYSYGGFMTNWLVTRTDRFRAAVAGGSISDLASYANTADVGGPFLLAEMGSERHEALERYRQLSPVEHAHLVTTPLLLLHAEQDQRCPLSQAEQMYGALTRLGATTRLVVYPGAGHGIRRDGLPSHRLDYGVRLVAWVDEHTRRDNEEAPGGS